ncbi:MAG: hypothetical protein JSU92_09270 [Deltaproteobacteria bacterium]|nr:MAG: hypothetical protein JSU92_09270 [Deltaproteobacteria bacterium]
MEKDEGKEVMSCCEDSSCCPPDQKDEGQLADGSGLCTQDSSGGNGLKSKLKTAVFVIVMLAAVGVAAHSVLKKNKVASMIEEDNEFRASMTEQKLCRSSLNSLIGLDEVAADKDFVFILLPGEREEAEKAAGVIEKASEIISRKGTRVATFTIKTDSPDYQKLVSSYGISSFPAVLATGKGCGANIVTGEITEEKLLAGYLQASKPGSCESKSPCCQE